MSTERQARPSSVAEDGGILARRRIRGADAGTAVHEVDPTPDGGLCVGGERPGFWESTHSLVGKMASPTRTPTPSPTPPTTASPCRTAIRPTGTSTGRATPATPAPASRTPRRTFRVLHRRVHVLPDRAGVVPTADDDIDRIGVLPPGTSGSVTVRVIDTDRTPGNPTADAVRVDELFVRVVP